MDETTKDSKPPQFRVAVVLMWLAFALGVAASALDPSDQHPLALAFAAAFLVFTAVATYYFSRARNWARVALLILFVMNAFGVIVIPDLLRRVPLLGWIFIAELILQASGLILAFTKPAAGAFKASSDRDDPAMRAILPVGRSGWAIASGYLALFSVLLIPAPFALVTGLLAIRDIRRHPERHGMGRAVFGVVMGVLGTAALVWLIARGMSRPTYR